MSESKWFEGLLPDRPEDKRQEHENQPDEKQARYIELANEFIKIYNENISPQILDPNGRYAGINIREFSNGLAVAIVSLILAQGEGAATACDWFHRFFWYNLFTFNPPLDPMQ